LEDVRVDSSWTVLCRAPLGNPTDSCRSPISRQILGFLVVGFDPDLVHPVLHLEPPTLEVGIKVGFLARELVALKAEVNTLLSIAGSDPTVWPQAGPLPAPGALSLCEIGEQSLEGGVPLKCRNESREPLGVDLKITQPLL
jgi:hypothetical protein